MCVGEEGELVVVRSTKGYAKICRSSLMILMLAAILGIGIEATIASAMTQKETKPVAVSSVQTEADIADEFYRMASGIWIDKENAFLSDEGELWCRIRMIDRGGIISWFVPVEGNNPSRFQIKGIKKISDGRYKVTMCLLGGSREVTEEVDLVDPWYAYFMLNNTKSIFWRADTEQKSLERAWLALIEYCKNYK